MVVEKILVTTTGLNTVLLMVDVKQILVISTQFVDTSLLHGCLLCFF